MVENNLKDLTNLEDLENHVKKNASLYPNLINPDNEIELKSMVAELDQKSRTLEKELLLLE